MSVLPVLVCGAWQVETVLLDHGTGWREWVEVRHGTDKVWHFGTRTEAQQLLDRYGLRLADFTPTGAIDDGCE